ncbi:unnamed protein product (macronuclear) [Paramecium tetraurelia]|uniref:Cyclin N-terminal domain-containing protein n=1 Tax=Paramecium tetraurelia TaxID=5888 RepID=A0BJ20_PARTE|nr:uncharacterized protein GSPATT00004910001 [Paramecium tetraurelia]CAK58537.1 unnamed protein product [Paramecium tetraurelia]|eukprot:XP_001425935.1 hypothetical protein (macronuclear) [Paramecium tetraurelia strain d4-2]
MLNCQHKPKKNICKLCGIAVYKDGSVAYKHNNFKSHQQAKNLFEDLSNINPNYERREELIDFLFQTKQRLQLTDQTFHLAIYYLDRCQHLLQFQNQKLISLLCLMVSSKMIEDDTHIPGMSKLSKASDLNLNKNEYKQAECLVLKTLNWKLKVSTLYEQVQSLLCIGVVFSTDTNDGILDNNIINFVCCKMLKDHSKIAYQVTKIPQLMQINTKILAMAIVLYMRKQCRLHPLPHQLQAQLEENQNQLLIDTYGQLNNLLQNNSLSNTKSVSRALSPNTLTTCKSMPPVTRVTQNARMPLNIITNHQICVKPKLIRSKHQEQDLNPLRVKHKNC